MSIKKADSAGFCFGVNRAINIVNELLEKGIKVATLGPIIHNMEMVHELEERGCTPVKAVDELTDDTTLVIRSHGVEKSVIDSLVKRGINFEDATCPFVKKIHKIVSNTNPPQANFVCPSTVRRQPPHIPVPSIIIGFMETVVGIL